MDEQQRRIQDDLRDVVTGDVFVDDLTRAAYSTDASILKQRPAAVVAPRSIEEIAEVIKYARGQELPLHARGGGTGLAGESLGPGIVLDVSRHLNQIVSLGPESVRVQPGVRWETLRQRLAPTGRMFAPDPLSGEQCTIGGMLATDAAGPHSLRYGTTRDHVLRIKSILATGEIVEFGQHSLAADGTDPSQTLARRIGEVCRDFSASIQEEQPIRLPKPGGYCLRGVLANGTVDLARLLVGSEGTLAIFAEAELSTLPVPPHRGVMLASFRTLDDAALAVLECLDFQPTACEMIDRRLLTVIRESMPVYERWIPNNAEALLLIEQEGNTEANVCARLRHMSERLLHKRLAMETAEIFQEPELSESWAIRTKATPKLAERSGRFQPIPFIENTAVPPEKLPGYLRRIQNVMKRHEVTASYAAHAGVGILHIRPLLDLQLADNVNKLEAISNDVLEAVLEFGGTFNAEHGVGLLRSGVLPRQFPGLYPAFCKIKGAFDPQNLLNPGKIVGAERAFPQRHLRTVLPPETPRPEPQLRWPELTVIESATRCNGCASCHSFDSSTRMCPTYKVLDLELAGPRAKANLLRQVFQGELDPQSLSTDEFRQFANLCIHCKMCKFECPNNVDVSKLVLEAKAAYAAENGLSRTDWFFANLEGWSSWCSRNAVFANQLLRSRVFRWSAELLWGLSRRRQIPRFHHQTFLRRAARNGWTRMPKTTKRRKVAFLADSFVNYQDPHLGECAVRVLQHAGCTVYVPPTQTGSGVSPLLYGDVESARDMLQWNLDVFAELVRDGYDVISPEPSAILMLREDGQGLIQSSDLRQVAERSYEFSEYLALLGERGELPDGMQTVPVTVGYHEPCHLRALQPKANVAALLRRVPRLRVAEVDLGCSGMALTFGMRADGFDMSFKAGSAMLSRMAQPDVQYAVTQCTGCRLQIEQGAKKRALHPAKWLAVAYGLVTRPEKLFSKPGRGLVVR